jgi:hypothetical protein
MITACSSCGWDGSEHEFSGAGEIRLQESNDPQPRVARSTTLLAAGLAARVEEQIARFVRGHGIREDVEVFCRLDETSRWPGQIGELQFTVVIPKGLSWGLREAVETLASETVHLLPVVVDRGRSFRVVESSALALEPGHPGFDLVPIG